MKKFIRVSLLTFSIFLITVFFSGCPDPNKPEDVCVNKMKISGSMFGEGMNIDFSKDLTLATYFVEYDLTAVAMLKQNVLLEDRYADIFILIPIDMETGEFDWCTCFKKPMITIDYLDNNNGEIDPDIYMGGVAGTTKLQKFELCEKGIKGTFDGTMSDKKLINITLENGSFCTEFYFSLEQNTNSNKNKIQLYNEFIYNSFISK